MAITSTVPPEPSGDRSTPRRRCPTGTLPNAEHAMLTEQHATAAQSAQAIRDIVDAVRTGTPTPWTGSLT